MITQGWFIYNIFIIHITNLLQVKIQPNILFSFNEENNGEIGNIRLNLFLKLNSDFNLQLNTVFLFYFEEIIINIYTNF